MSERYINAYELDGSFYSVVRNAGGDTDGAVLLNTEDGSPVDTVFTVYPYGTLSSLSDNKAVIAFSKLTGRSCDDVRRDMRRSVVAVEVDDTAWKDGLQASNVRTYTQSGSVRFLGRVDEPFAVAYGVIVDKAMRLYDDVTQSSHSDLTGDFEYVRNVFESLLQLRSDADRLIKSMRRFSSYRSDVMRYSRELGINLPVIDERDGNRLILDSSATYLQRVCRNKAYEDDPQSLVSAVNEVRNLLYGVLTWQTGIKYASEHDRDMLVRIAMLETAISGTDVVHMSLTDETIDNAAAVMLEAGIRIDASYGDMSLTRTAASVIPVDDLFRFIDIVLSDEYASVTRLARFVTDDFSDDEYAKVSMRHTGFLLRLFDDITIVASEIGKKHETLGISDDEVLGIATEYAIPRDVIDHPDDLLANVIRVIAYVKGIVGQDVYDTVASSIAFAPDGIIDDDTYVPARIERGLWEYDEDYWGDEEAIDNSLYIEIEDEQLDEYRNRLVLVAFAGKGVRTRFAERHHVAVMRGFMTDGGDSDCGTLVRFENLVDGHGVRWDVIDAEFDACDGIDDIGVDEIGKRLADKGVAIYDPESSMENDK